MIPDFKKAPRLSDQVTSFLLKEIKSGSYPPGNSLPPENTLAKRFNVSRTVIREALARLKYDGILESRQGSGARIARPGEARSLYLDVEPADDLDSLAYLYELRAVLEGDAAALAAERRTSAHLKDLSAYLDEMGKALEEGGDGSEADAAFHLVVVDASGNPYLRDFSTFVGDRLRELIRRARERVSRDPSIGKSAQQEHTEIYRAIAQGDPVRAKKAALRHLKYAFQRQGIRRTKGITLPWEGNDEV